MAIVYDPHQKVSGNLLVGKTQAIVSGRFRLIFPTDGPFFSGSVELFHAGVKLVEGRDYLFSHIYPTSILRTARRVHGGLWIINDKLNGAFTLTAHYLGHGKATPAQITAERQANAIKIPTKCYWEDVIGIVYFPPVDIQFDRTGWQGEQEVMNALGSLAQKMSEPPPVPNPFEDNPNFSPDVLLNAGFEYLGGGAFLSKDDNFGSVVSELQLRGNDVVEWTLKSAKNASSVGPVFFSTGLMRDNNGPGVTMEVTVHGNVDITVFLPGNQNQYNVLRTPFPKPLLAAGVKARVDYDTVNGIYKFGMVSGNTVIVNYTLDLNNPPASIAAEVVSSNAKVVFDRGLSLKLSTYPESGGQLIFHNVPGMQRPAVDTVYGMLVTWKEEIDALFKNSPAIEHVKDKTNPHGDSWGWLRALQLNGIASDTAKIDGRLQGDFAAAINAQLPKLSNLTGVKVPRHSLSSVNLSGTFGTRPGLTSITGSKTSGDEDDVESVTTFDPKAAMLLSKGGYKLSYTAPNGLRIKSGTNVLELLPTQNKATWNGKELLTPLTVGPHLPGGESGGDGLFYGVTTPTVEITGNGITGVPFLATWVPPNASNLNVHALRRLTDAFGYSDSLVATPALVKKLDVMFTGKLLMDKATVNGLSLSQSVQLDKSSIGLDRVADMSDENMLISDSQAIELDKYSLADHVHEQAEFGIGNATTAKVGLVRFGGFVNDAALALPGDLVVRMYDRVTNLEETVAAAGVDVAVDITRYGPVGNRVIENHVTVNGMMITIKPQTYYLRRQYPVPVASFNLQELFPASAQNGDFYIYVDMKDNAAFYLVSDKKLVETDTVTEIGTVVTEGGVVTLTSVRSVTRLGDFRELDEHVLSITDHVRYKPSAAEMMGLAKHPISALNGLAPVPDATKWRYDWRYGYENITAVTAGFSVTAIQNRGGANDLPLRLAMEYYGYSPDGAKVTWWSSSNMKLQYRVDPTEKRVEIWLLGTFGSTSLPGTYIRHGMLPTDYLSKPLRFTVDADGNDGSAVPRNLTFTCHSGENEVLNVTFNETPEGRPLNSPSTNWSTVFNAAGTVTLAMPVNPKGKAVVVENTFEALRPMDFKTVKAVVHTPGILGVARGLADWRLCDVNGAYVPNVNSGVFEDAVEFVPNPGNASLHRILKQLCPIRHDKAREQRLSFSARATGGDNTVLEIMLGGFKDSAGRLRRFSVILNNSNYVTNANGNLVILGFAIDFGKPSQIIIGAPAPQVSGAFNWQQLGNMACVLNFMAGQIELSITIKGLVYFVVFAYGPSTVTLRFSPGPGNSGFSAVTHDLKPYLSQLGLSATTLFSPDVSHWWGVGATLDNKAYFEFDHSDGLTPLIGGGDNSLTAFDGYLEHLSAANAVRVYEEAIPDADVGLSVAEIKASFIKRKTELDATGTLFSINPNNVHLTLDLANKRLQAVVYR